MCQFSPASPGTSSAPYCSSHKKGRAARGPALCQILLHLPNCFPLKQWQRCYGSITSLVLLHTFSLASTGSDANLSKLCQTSIKTLCDNPFLKEMAKGPKYPDGALITFPHPLWLINTGKDTKLPRVTLQIFEGLPNQRNKNTSVLLACSFSYMLFTVIYKLISNWSHNDCHFSCLHHQQSCPKKKPRYTRAISLKAMTHTSAAKLSFFTCVFTMMGFSSTVHPLAGNQW